MKKLFTIYYLLMLSIFCEAQMEKYNVVWNTQSKNANETMPCGGGDIGLNVWVENNELLIYVQRSGSFNEDNALLKSGRIRVILSPNIFEGTIFKQELHLQQGYITVEGKNNGLKATIKIWVDVFNPVVHIDINANKKINVAATYESWRYQDRVLIPRENFANSWKWAPPKNNLYKKDDISFSTGGVLFYHNNGEKSIFDSIVAQQGMLAVKDQLYNPLKNLAFGGLFRGDNFIADGETNGIYTDTDFKGWKLKSKSATNKQSLTLTLHTQQVKNFGEWHQSLKSILLKADDKTAFAKTQLWWKQFWDRSFININSAVDTVSQVGSNYQLFRYMLGCNAYGNWPTKFNGGLFTTDPVFVSKQQLTPDYRNWGGGVHTAQNQRLVYFPMIKNGDWDMMQSQFDFYLRILKNAELRSKVYWNHDGACFTEQMENFGLPNYAEYGVKRPANFDKGVEYNAWLEYEWDTVLEFCLMMLEENRYTGKNIDDKINFIISCLKFFDEHYQYLAKQRSIAALDGDGKLVLYPGSGAETFKMANNSTATIVGLKTVASTLQQYLQVKRNSDTVVISKINYLQKLQQRLPEISFRHFDGHITIAPAKTWERIKNIESPQLYPVFPWRLYGIGKPGLDTAVNTYIYDTLVQKFKSPIGWKQDNIWAANLGLVNDAWNLTAYKLKNGNKRFPAFWGPGFDWLPDHNWGGSGMIGLQDMLLQNNENKILLFAAWPKNIDVHFKLNAYYNTTVEAKLKNGKVALLKVLPESRAKDVEVLLK